MQVVLHVQSSGGSSTRFDAQPISLTGDGSLIGRAPDCDLHLDSKLLSRRHCVILQDRYAVTIRDLDSKNGTFVNGGRIHGDVLLNDGDSVDVGEMTFRVEIS